MSSYSDKETKPVKKRRGRPKKAPVETKPAPAPEPESSPAPAPASAAPVKKARKGAGPMSEKQKSDLRKHMEETGLTGTEAKKHRMGMMARVRKGMTIKSAHADLMGK